MEVLESGGWYCYFLVYRGICKVKGTERLSLGMMIGDDDQSSSDDH